MKPAAVLVAAFQIHHGVLAAIDLALDAGELREMHRVLQHEGVGRAGVEPDVADVVDLFPAVVGELAEEALARAGLVPGVGAFSSKASTMRTSTSGSSRMSTEPSGFLMNTAIGTPQARWREITQSGRLSIMPVMRFCPAPAPSGVSDGSHSSFAQSRMPEWFLLSRSPSSVR